MAFAPGAMGTRLPSRVSQIAIAIVLAAALLALAIYVRPMSGRYQFKIANGEYQRFDTWTGEAMFCRRVRCHIYTREGALLTPVDGNPFANAAEAPESPGGGQGQ